MVNYPISVSVCECARMRACVHVCVRVCMCVRVYKWNANQITMVKI